MAESVMGAMMTDDNASTPQSAAGPELGAQPAMPAPEAQSKDRITALAAIYQADRVFLSHLTTLAVTLTSIAATLIVVLIPIAPKLSYPWILALPTPVWMVFGYRAIIGAKFNAYRVSAFKIENELIAAAGLSQKRWARGVAVDLWRYKKLWAGWGSKFLFYGVATLGFTGFNLYCLWRGRPGAEGSSSSWLFWIAIALYILAAFTLARSWWSITGINEEKLLRWNSPKRQEPVNGPHDTTEHNWGIP